MYVRQTLVLSEDDLKKILVRYINSRNDIPSKPKNPPDLSLKMMNGSVEIDDGWDKLELEWETDLND